MKLPLENQLWNIMSRVRYHLTEHAALDSIPLRMGRVPSFRKVWLENIDEDDSGTQEQTFTQRRRGNRHLIADIWTESAAGECLGRWRIVTAPLKDGASDPPIVTILPSDRSQARTASNLSDYLKNERLKGTRLWLTPEYVATTLYPLVVSGELQNQTQLADHIFAVDSEESFARVNELESRAKDAELAAEEAKRREMEHQRKADEAHARAERAEEGEKSALARLAVALQQNGRQQLTESPSSTPATQMSPAVAVTERWRSKTGSDYVNIGVRAYLDAVERENNNIRLTFINSSGQKRTIYDFGRYGFVSGVFAYLERCKDNGVPAVFIVTQKPGGNLMLASDTMMLPQYKSLWRFS